MAGRPTKAGLDYFDLDCHMEEKVRLIQAEFGYKSFAIVVKLYQKIYGEFGYYCEWNEDSLLLFMSENGVSSCEEKNYIKEVVSACIKRDIFSEKIYKEYGVLTSVGVQKRYFNAISKRKSVELKKEYLLISVGKNPISDNKNSINDGRNSINDVRNSQSRVEESRVDNNIPPISPFKGDECGQTKNSKTEKHRHGEYGHVLLTDSQLDKLFTDYGESNTQDAIKFLDEYIQMKGYKAKDHNLALRKWVFRAVEEEKQRNRGVNHVKSQSGNTNYSCDAEDYALAVFRANK